MDKAVVLLSGGMDSVTLLNEVVARRGVPHVHALSFVYGQKHGRELESARWQAERLSVVEHRVVDLSVFGSLTTGGSALTDPALGVPDMASLDDREREQPPTYVPHRNLVMLSIAAAHAEAIGAADVFYGAQAQDEYGYWDCTAEFVRRLNRVLALNRRTPVQVHAPFVGKSKGDVLKIGLELGVDYGHTWTCYRGGSKPCGTCPSCEERTAAFRQAGAADPLSLL